MSARAVTICVRALGSPGTDHGELARRGTELAAAEEELAQAEETWLELAAAVEERGLEL